MRTFLIPFMIFFFGFSPSINDSVALKKGMVHFEEAFIPTWYYSLKSDSEQARKSVFYLAFEWNQFHNRFAKQYPENPQWEETFDRVSGWLGDAYTAIDDNCFDEAYNQLDHARYELMELRRRNGVDYYLDYLYDYEIELVAVLEVANDPMLCLLEWKEFAYMVEEMNRYWTLADQQAFPNRIFNWSKEDIALMQLQKGTIQQQLEAFNEAMEGADQCKIIEAGGPLLTSYLELIILFGNFKQQTNTFLG